MTVAPPDVAANLAEIRAQIAREAEAAHRAERDIALIAVSKKHEEARIRPALMAGHRLFGENRVQEALKKWPPLRADFPDTRIHLIGPLQTNKVPEAVAFFDAIQTVDRPKLAQSIARAAQHQGRCPECYVQVNTGDEPQKAGVSPAAADAFIESCRHDTDLPIIGLMCIPPIEDNPAPHFGLLKMIAERNGLSRLSMGMSADFPVAIQLGATEVRIGTGVFGTRPAPDIR